MSQTKNNQNKLEKLRGIFFQIGLIIAGGITLLAFEWTTPIYIADLPSAPEVEVEDWDIIPIIPIEEEVKKPKVKETTLKTNPDIIEIVKNDTKEVEKKEEKKEEPKFNPGDWKEKEDIKEKDVPSFGAEKMPEFKGGIKKLFKYLADNIKYPDEARRAGIEGKVHVQFVVNKKGEIKDVTILRGVNKWLDEEAIRVVKSMPNWKPGKQHGKAVSVYYMLPINFKLKG